MNDAERIAALSVKVAELEAKVEFLLGHCSVPYTAPDVPYGMEMVAKHIKRGDTLEAIRVHRAATGSGLAEAKEAVELLAKKLGL